MQYQFKKIYKNVVRSDVFTPFPPRVYKPKIDNSLIFAKHLSGFFKGSTPPPLSQGSARIAFPCFPTGKCGNLPHKEKFCRKLLTKRNKSVTLYLARIAGALTPKYSPEYGASPLFFHPFTPPMCFHGGLFLCKKTLRELRGSKKSADNVLISVILAIACVPKICL